MTSEEHNKDEEYHKERAIPSAAAPERLFLIEPRANEPVADCPICKMSLKRLV